MDGRQTATYTKKFIRPWTKNYIENNRCQTLMNKQKLKNNIKTTYQTIKTMITLPITSMFSFVFLTSEIQP